MRDADNGEVRVVDPSGERPPKSVMQVGEGWATARTSEGYVVLRPDLDDSTVGDLIMYRWPADIWTDEPEPEVLVEGVRTSNGNVYQNYWDALQGFDDELFFIDVEDELVRMDVTTAALEVLATDVLDFKLGFAFDDSELGYAVRYLLWQHTELSNDDPEHLEGEVMLLDRGTEQLSSLGHGMLLATSSAVSWTTSGLVALRSKLDGEPVMRLFQLPSLSYIDVPTNATLYHVLDDDRHFVAHMDEGEPLGILDVQTGEFERFTSYFPQFAFGYWEDERAALLLPGYDSDDPYGESELYMVRADEPPELFAKRATVKHELLPDGRLLTGINLNEDGIGDLIVVDDFEERLIDRNVSTVHLKLAPVGEDLLTYAILEGERAGLWLARLPARD